MSAIPWIIAIIEGFSTLAVEVIAIRLAVPVVGSSITLTGVMLGVVLFALSAGYWRGGTLSARWDRQKTRLILARNLFLAAVLYGALAFPLEAHLLESLLNEGLGLALAIGAMASLLFLLPIYLASQTVPMLAEITNDEGKAGKASGKVLFYSTVGSVLGGIITPVWLFPTLGVVRSTWVVCILLAIAAAVMGLSHLKSLKTAGIGIVALVAVVSANALALPSDGSYSFDSAYQSFRVIDDADNPGGRVERVLLMAGGRASGIWADTGETSFVLLREVARLLTEVQAADVLVVGSAGFTFPRDAAAMPFVRSVDAVDVDPAVKDIAEKWFLRQPLPAKVRFMPLSARYAVRKLRRDGRRYGFTLVDAFIGRGIPEELVTVEFFRDVQQVSERTALNVIMDRKLASPFARGLLASFREAFGSAWVRQVKPKDTGITNILVTSWPAPGATPWTGAGEAYRDDRNRADHDHVEMMWNTAEDDE